MVFGAQSAYAAQGSLFDDFIRDCASHAGDASAALNAVSRQGWKPVPQQKLQMKLPPISMPGLKADWYHAYLGAQPGRSLALFAGRGEMATGTSLRSVPVSFCMVVQKPIDPTSLQRIGSWTNATKVAVSASMSGYVFAESSSGRQSISLSQLYKEFQSGAGREVVAIDQPAEHVSAAMILAPFRQEQ